MLVGGLARAQLLALARAFQCGQAAHPFAGIAVERLGYGELAGPATRLAAPRRRRPSRLFLARASTAQGFRLGGARRRFGLRRRRGLAFGLGLAARLLLGLFARFFRLGAAARLRFLKPVPRLLGFLELARILLLHRPLERAHAPGTLHLGQRTMRRGRGIADQRGGGIGGHHLLHGTAGRRREGPLALDLHLHGLGPAMRKALPNLPGLDRFLELEPPGPGQGERLLPFGFRALSHTGSTSNLHPRGTPPTAPRP